MKKKIKGKVLALINDRRTDGSKHEEDLRYLNFFLLQFSLLIFLPKSLNLKTGTKGAVSLALKNQFQDYLNIQKSMWSDEMHLRVLRQ